MQNIDQIKADFQKNGYRLAEIANGITGKPLGYRITNNHTRIHFDRTISAEKVLSIHSRITK